MAAMETEVIRQWFTKADDDGCLEPARQAFEEAEMIFKTHLTKDTKKQKIYFSSSNLDDVLATVKVAEARYDLHRNKTSKLREGLSRFSKLLHHYANIIEVFVQHHPEYVALAWGAMKVVLVMFLAHESTILALTDGLCQVASALPRVNISIILYPTPHMKRAVAQLYAYILRFLTRAKGWFEESWLKHVWHSLSRPVEMRFSGLIGEIKSLSEAVNQLAISGSWAEQREMHRKIDVGNEEITSFRREFRERMDEMSISLKRIKAGDHINTNHTLTPTQALSMIATIARPVPFDVAKVFRRSMSMRNRRVQHRLTPSAYPWATPGLRLWSERPSSSSMVILSNASSRLQAQDMAVSIIDLLRRAKVPVLWELDQGTARSSLDVMRNLAAQALQLSLADKTEAFAAALISRTDSKTDEPHYLARLLNVALRDSPCVYVVVHTETLWSGVDPGDRACLSALLGSLLQEHENGPGVNFKALLFQSVGTERLQMPVAGRDFLEVRAPNFGGGRRGQMLKRLPARRTVPSKKL